jgi:IS30 family transposase
MRYKVKTNQKHLTLEQRKHIEEALNQNMNMKEIAKFLSKDPTTISKEIKKHRILKGENRFNQFSGGKAPELCKRLKRAPWVCNGCSTKHYCRKIRYNYSSNIAMNDYKYNLSDARIGFNLTRDELVSLDRLVSPLLERRQPINHIYANHSDEIKFSKMTLYNYIDAGLLSVNNLDLPRKVRYKKRKINKDTRTKRDRAIRNGRTYQDFSDYINEHPEASIVEIDTVEGIKGGKVLLTLLFRNSKLMLAFLMDNSTTENVGKVFNYLKNVFGVDDFKKHFEVILTDNGSEFSNPLSMEVWNETGEIVSNVFFCDSNCSWQKGALEKNHEFIRYVLPKGTPFDKLTQEDILKLINNINSLCRLNLNNKCPYDLSLFFISEEILNKLRLKKIDHDSVNLRSNLLKK